MTSPDDPLESLMAAMADGDTSAIWTFHELYQPRLRGVVLSNLRSMYRPDVAADDDRVMELTAEAAIVIFHRAGGWKPGGARPWSWANRAIRSMIAAEIGHRSVELGHDDSLDGEAGVALVSTGGDTDLTIDALVELDSTLGTFVEAYRSVSSDRDQDAAWLFRVQKVNGDPSPAHTVADEFGITPDHARQIHKRHFTRVHDLVWNDDRFAAIRAWDWFAA